jgi:hypothetical protein
VSGLKPLKSIGLEHTRFPFAASHDIEGLKNQDVAIIYSVELLNVFRIDVSTRTIIISLKTAFSWGQCMYRWPPVGPKRTLQ